MRDPQDIGFTCAIVGLKGFEFLGNIVDRGAKPSRVISYDQSTETLRSFEMIKDFCSERDIPFETNKRPDFEASEIVFVVGWQFLIFNRPEHMIVFHDSLLPKYRGFAPTVSAMINGDKHLGVTAMIPADGVDDGLIVDQWSFQVSYPLDIASALKKQAEGMAGLTVSILSKLQLKQLSVQKQDHTKATYSIWRDADDYWLDWQQSSSRLLRTIDALGPPYEGARTLYCGQTILIRKAEPVPDIPFEIRQPGKIWKIEENMPVVVCGDGLVRLVVAMTIEGELVKFEKLRCRLSSPAEIAE